MSDDIRSIIESKISEAQSAQETPAAEPAAATVDSGQSVAMAQGVLPTLESGESGGGSEAASVVQSGRARDASGKFVKGETTKTETPKPQKHDATQAPKQGDAQATPAPQVGQPTQTTPPKYKAPQSWGALVKEKWGSLSEDIQAEISKREKDVTTSLSQAVDNKTFRDQFQQTVSPFEAMIRAEGLQPLQVVQQALQFATALRTAPPAHKAQLLAGLVKTFSIPIDVLDSVLAGESVQPSQQNQQIDPVQLRQQIKQELLQDMQAQRSQSVQQQALQQVQSFGQDKEFFDDLRDDMHVLLSTAAQRGVAMTLEAAYNKALLMHKADDGSEIGQVLRQREAAERAKAAAASTQQARAASSSIRHQPTAPVANGSAGQTVRGALEASIAALQGR